MSRVYALSTLVLMSTVASTAVLAQNSIRPRQFGVVEAPTAGSMQVPLDQLPAFIRHTAQVALKEFEQSATLVSAQLDTDDVLAVYEIAGETADGRSLEVDVRPDGKVEELEIQIGEDELPGAVSRARSMFAPAQGEAAASGSAPAQSGGGLIEKSIRPSDVGLPEIWYEFSGTEFDVEIRSDGKAVLFEPA